MSSDAVPGSAGVSPAVLLSPRSGWHSRGYLPHFDAPGTIQSVTFRLFDALPLDVLSKLAGSETQSPEARRRIEQYMDAGHGECWLARHDLAEIVQNALLHFDGTRYRLITWVVMPNHVHVLIEELDGRPLDGIVHSWKSFTSRELNGRLSRTGQVWQPEYFDRFIRDAAHLDAVMSYIESNPVSAGLCSKAEEWRFGSARFRSPVKTAGETPALPGNPENVESVSMHEISPTPVLIRSERSASQCSK